jgi:hypothetical protein
LSKKIEKGVLKGISATTSRKGDGRTKVPDMPQKMCAEKMALFALELPFLKSFYVQSPRDRL